MLQPEEPGAIGDENILRIGHVRWTEQSIPVSPRSAKLLLKLKLIIVIGSQARGVHPHHRRHRREYGCSRRLGDPNRWRIIGVAGARTGNAGRSEERRVGEEGRSRW